MAGSTTWLTRYLQDLDSKLAVLNSRPAQIPNSHTIEEERIREEMASVKQCLSICAEASERAQQERVNIFEDVSMADDGQQVIVSTLGDLILARRVTAGARSMQLMGQMSDESLQQLSQNRNHSVVKKDKGSDAGIDFKERYGEGLKLSTRDS
jgi:hypothetical protein